MILFEEFKINPRATIVISFQLRSGNKIDKILISLVVDSKQYYFIDFIVFISIGSSLLGELEFYSYNRLDSFINTGFVEFKSPIHITNISDGNSGLSECFCSFCESLRIPKCLLKSVVRMCMEMNKRHGPSI